MSSKRCARTAQSLTDLPANILIEILARLPLRTLFASMSVCKTFLTLTTPNPHFTDLHSSHAAPILVFQFRDGYGPSYILSSTDSELAPQKSEPKPLFELPKMGSTLNLYRTNFREQNKFSLVNSCKGLVFFFSFPGSLVCNPVTNDTVTNEYEGSIVCNPVTNEYVMIPQVDPKIRLDSPTKSMWLGFSPSTGQYKVLRISGGANDDPAEVAAQVFVIGSGSWRDIDDTPPWRGLTWNLCSTLGNGFMYWLSQLWCDIFSFDFEREKFGKVALPVEVVEGQEEQFRNKNQISIGVLGGCLCLTCNDFDAQHVDLWVMRKCGNGDLWRKELVIRPTGGSVFGQLKPLQFLRNGELVMLWMGNDLVCYDPRTKSLRFFGSLRLSLVHKVASLTPSFVPLKETLKVEKVLNRCMRPSGSAGAVKLANESNSYSSSVKQ